jgi:hypothetical protein
MRQDDAGQQRGIIRFVVRISCCRQALVGLENDDG